MNNTFKVTVTFYKKGKDTFTKKYNIKSKYTTTKQIKYIVRMIAVSYLMRGWSIWDIEKDE